MIGTAVMFFLLLNPSSLADFSNKEVVELSLELKQYQRNRWGIDPGVFATKDSKGKQITQYRMYIQDRLKLAHNYLGSVIVDFDEKPDPEKFKSKTFDVRLRLAARSGTDEVTYNIVLLSRAKLISTIFHEDFHAYTRTYPVVLLRSIEESFAAGFDDMAALEAVRDLYKNENLVRELKDMSRQQNALYTVLNACYKDLKRLYGSSISAEQKLRKREVIFRRCEAESGFKEINNAVLSDTITYSRYYFYATGKIKKFGLDRFVRAHVLTFRQFSEQNLGGSKLRRSFSIFRIFRSGKKSDDLFGEKCLRAEKIWLERFEKNLKKSKT